MHFMDFSKPCVELLTRGATNAVAMYHRTYITVNGTLYAGSLGKGPSLRYVCCQERGYLRSDLAAFRRRSRVMLSLRPATTICASIRQSPLPSSICATTDARDCTNASDHLRAMPAPWPIRDRIAPRSDSPVCVGAPSTTIDRREWQSASD